MSNEIKINVAPATSNSNASEVADSGDENKGAVKHSTARVNHGLTPDGDDTLTVLPESVSAGLRRSDFASKILQLEYLQRLCDVRIAAATARKKELAEMILEEQGMGDPMRAKERKFAKLMEQTAALRAELSSQGIDVDALLKNL